MSIHEAFIVAVVLAFMIAFGFIFPGIIRFDSMLMAVSGFVSLIVIFVFVAYSAKPSHPSWSAMRPIVQEAAAFRHDPPAITADWRRLQAGHRLTEDQWFAFRHWVNREQEIRARRVVERIAADHLRARARKVPHSRTSKAR
jgi:hypothetical protein